MKDMPRAVRLGLHYRQMVWVTAAVTLPMLILASIAIQTVDQDTLGQAQDRASLGLSVLAHIFGGKGAGAAIVDGKMVLGGKYVVNGNNEIVDTVASMLGDNVTIFQGDTRISTTVRNSDGSRAIGTQAAANVVDQVLRQGQRYVGRAWVVNAWYLAAYDPIRDASGTVIGMLFVGTPEKPFVEISDSFRNRTLLVLALGLLLALAIGYANARSLSEPIHAMTAAAKAIAEGEVNLQVSLDEKRGDELGEMARAFRRMAAYVQEMASAAELIAARDLSVQVQPRSDHDVLGLAFRRMVEGLRELTIELQESSLGLSAAVNDIMTAVSQQSAGAAEQSAAVTQTSATVDEVASSSEQAVQMAMVVSETAQQANRQAGDGVAALGDSTEGMADIRQKVQSIAENILALSEQSQQIGEIIATVSDLADQSNLLALNAAIEASRAGEHGKGFAVVASEIRSLAEQSKAATAQVRTILSDIQRATNAAVMATEQGTKGVDKGVQLIDQTGRTIGQLADAVRQASQSAAQIAASVRQHSVGMQQIASAMAHIDQATNQGLSATTNTRNAAEKLTQLAERLNRLLAQYQVSDEDRRGAGRHQVRTQPQPPVRRPPMGDGREDGWRGRTPPPAGDGSLASRR